MYCKNCGKEISEDNVVCKYCGKDLKSKNVNEETISKKKKSNTLEMVLSLITIFVGIFIAVCVQSFYIFIFAFMVVIMGFASMTIGDAKGINAGFYWGWLFGIIGLIVVCGLPNRLENKNIVVNISKYDELEKLQSLKVKGILTQQEYELEKQKILEN